MLPVAGNTAIIMPLSAAWVTLVAPATVKELAATPVNVYPANGVRVMVAVNVVFAAKVPDTAGDHVTVPVY